MEELKQWRTWRWKDGIVITCFVWVAIVILLAVSALVQHFLGTGRSVTGIFLFVGTISIFMIVFLAWSLPKVEE